MISFLIFPFWCVAPCSSAGKKTNGKIAIEVDKCFPQWTVHVFALILIQTISQFPIKLPASGLYLLTFGSWRVLILAPDYAWKAHCSVLETHTLKCVESVPSFRHTSTCVLAIILRRQQLSARASRWQAKLLALQNREYLKTIRSCLVDIFKHDFFPQPSQPALIMPPFLAVINSNNPAKPLKECS